MGSELASLTLLYRFGVLRLLPIHLEVRLYFVYPASATRTALGIFLFSFHRRFHFTRIHSQHLWSGCSILVRIRSRFHRGRTLSNLMEIPYRFPDYPRFDVYGSSLSSVNHRVRNYLMYFFQVTLIWMPESPRYLAKIGRIDDAKAILRRLRSKDSSDITVDEKLHKTADSELADIMQVIQLEKKHAKMNNYWNMFWGIGSGDLHIARRVQLSIWLQIVQECALMLIPKPSLLTEYT